MVIPPRRSLQARMILPASSVYGGPLVDPKLVSSVWEGTFPETNEFSPENSVF